MGLHGLSETGTLPNSKTRELRAISLNSGGVFVQILVNLDISMFCEDVGLNYVAKHLN